jgi:hypothetical protein
MNQTISKLEEAKFFLVKMKESKNIDPDFTHYLNAFISSARSIAWVMRAEYSKVSGWEEWYKQYPLSDEEYSLLNAFNDARVSSQKIAPIKPTVKFYVDVSSQDFESYQIKAGKLSLGSMLKLTFPGSQEAHRRDESQDKIALVGKVAMVNIEINQLPEIDIINASEKYFNSLQSLVRECNNKFMI